VAKPSPRIWYNVSTSASFVAPERRNIFALAASQGWRAYFEALGAATFRAAGIDGVEIHNPYGVMFVPGGTKPAWWPTGVGDSQWYYRGLPETEMVLDAWHRARDWGQRRAVDSFPDGVAYLKSLGLRVMVYLGLGMHQSQRAQTASGTFVLTGQHYNTDPWFADETSNPAIAVPLGRRRDTMVAWAIRAMHAVIDLGVDIGVDVASDIMPGSPMRDVLTRVRNQGRRVYWETWHYNNRPDRTDEHVFVTSETARAIDVVNWQYENNHTLSASTGPIPPWAETGNYTPGLPTTAVPGRWWMRESEINADILVQLNSLPRLTENNADWPPTGPYPDQWRNGCYWDETAGIMKGWRWKWTRDTVARGRSVTFTDVDTLNGTNIRDHLGLPLTPPDDFGDGL
jgi:hypothetical protein